MGGQRVAWRWGAGTYTGAVRAVMGESDFEPVQAGEVPVCPITSPVWSVLFPSVGALVTDTGAAFLPPGLVNGYRKIERS